MFLSSVNIWKPVPSVFITQRIVFQLVTTGSFFALRKKTSISPVFDHDGLKSSCPLPWGTVTGFLPSSVPKESAQILPLA